MFKEQDGKGCTPYDLGQKVAENEGEYFNPYDDLSDEYSEFEDGYYDNTRDNEEEEDWSA